MNTYHLIKMLVDVVDSFVVELWNRSHFALVDGESRRNKQVVFKKRSRN